jgi:CzcA family heavy metal efflux pump
VNLAEWAATHRRSILFLLAIASIGGALSALDVPVALFPSVSFPRIAIAIDAGDRPALQMVTQVTRPIEEAVKSVPGLREVRSTTSRGSAEASLSFDWSTDMRRATLETQAEIARVLPALPPGTTFDVRRMDPFVFPVIAYSLTSESLSLTRLREIAQYELLPLLSSIDGVARAEVLGGSAREIAVDVDPVRLVAHGITADDVVKALANVNVLSVVGRTEDRHKLLLALADAKLTTLDDVRSIIVRGSPNGAVRLQSVADVHDATAPNWTAVTADGRPAVILQVKQQPNGNSVEISNQVDAALRAYAPKLPPSVRLSNWYDQSELVSGAARSVLEAASIGVLLAGGVLFAFMRSLRITVITLIYVPAVLATTVLLLRVLDMSFNIMTLGGMAAAIGLVIDDAIVMIEQIERRLVGDTANKFAQIRAAATEFLRPLTGSSAATVVIFLPLAFLSGVTGTFFKALSLTLASALVVSFLAAAFVVPLLADTLIHARRADAGPSRVASWYRRTFSHITQRPFWPVAMIAALLLAGGVAYTGVGSGFMPRMDEGGFVFDYIAPPGTSLTDTNAMLQRVEAILRSIPEVRTYSRRTGLQLGGGLTEANTGDIFVRLQPPPRRDVESIMAEVRRRVADAVPGLEVETAQLMEDLIGDLTAVPQPIEIKIFGDDAAVLRSTAEHVAAAIATVPGVTEIKSGVVLAGDAIDIRIDPLRAAVEGLDPARVADQVKTLLAGSVATQVQRDERAIDVRVRLPAAIRTTTNDLAEFRLATPSGATIPLHRIADLELLTGQPQITRDDLKPMVAVTARIEDRDLGSTVADVKALLARSDLFPRQTYYELGGLYAQQQIAFAGLLRVLVAAFALVFLLLLFMYERFTVAITIIAMPLLALSAVFVGLWATGIELNISAMMGMTMVVGIVTEIAIFYFCEYESLRRDGMPHEVALVEAGVNRMRPIAMTTIAAILALLPLALALGQGSQMQQPLAIAIISGLVVQMPLVLLLMPMAYARLYRGAR